MSLWGGQSWLQAGFQPALSMCAPQFRRKRGSRQRPFVAHRNQDASRRVSTWRAKFAASKWQDYLVAGRAHPHTSRITASVCRNLSIVQQPGKIKSAHNVSAHRRSLTSWRSAKSAVCDDSEGHQIAASPSASQSPSRPSSWFQIGGRQTVEWKRHVVQRNIRK